MHFTRCTENDVAAAMGRANRAGGYDLEWSHTSGQGLNFRGRILPANSHVKGARRAASGRRVRAACWHAHRDVLAALFDAVPGAKVVTAMATYDGKDDYERKFAYTYETPTYAAGFQPSYGSLCDCEE